MSRPISEAETAMLDQLQTWWQNATPETQAALWEGGLVLAALAGGHFLGALVARALRAHDFDGALGGPGWSPPAAPAGRRITPTLLAGLLVRLTVWAAAARWLAQQHGRADLAATLGLIISRTWALAAVLGSALALGGLLARRLLVCLHGPAPAGLAALPARNGAVGPRPDGTGAVAAGAYALAVLLVLLTAADLFDWPLTRSAALALWQLAQHLLVAGAALLIGYLGARWARDLATPEGGASPERQAGHYTALGVMAATTVLAVTVLLASAGVLLGVAALAGLGGLVWGVRGHLPDVAAGLQLRAYKVREVCFDGTAWQVAGVGLLTTEVTRAGEFCRYPNRVVFEARLHGAPTEAASR
jgi:hypothetical protein